MIVSGQNNCGVWDKPIDEAEAHQEGNQMSEIAVNVSNSYIQVIVIKNTDHQSDIEAIEMAIRLLQEELI